jgi:hypothetical protein
LLLYAWYVPIVAGNRMILALFLPFMYSLAYIIRTLDAGRRNAEGPYPWLFTAIHVVMIAGLLLELRDILTDRIVTVYGGE